MASFARLLPAGPPVDALEALAGWRDEPPPPGRPRLALNMVASVDGRATIGGRSAPLSSPADRELFHALRLLAGAVMAGGSTMQIERYGPTIPDPDRRELRASWGLSPQPPAVIASRSLDLDPALPLLADPQSHVIVIGPSRGKLEGARARLDYIHSETLADGLAQLRERFEIGLVVCEGGPTLAALLVRERLLDELFLALSPQLVDGDPGLTILAGSGAADPLRLRLRMLLAHEDELYAHYAVG
jgi:riboflavin biosynthesis pyrimidine reductase